MKIIGVTEKGYIIDANADEIANLTGYYSEYSEKFNKKLKAGDEIKVDEMYKQLYHLSKKRTELAQTVKTLRNLADLLEPVCPVIERAIETATEE